MLAPILASHTRIGGRIALAGILEEQSSEVAGAYGPWARLEIAARQDGWVLLAGTRAR
jgi:ribosomal protein L11 methyltransferase